MATAAAVRITPADLAQVVTTSDAALTIVYVDPFVGSVVVQMTSAAGGYVQTEGAVQDAAVGTAVGELTALGSWEVTRDMCGRAANGDWYFGVARSAAGAVFRLIGVMA